MKPIQINPIKINDKVTIKDCNFYDISDGDRGTVLFDRFDLAFVETVKSNSYDFKTCENDASITCKHGIWIAKHKLTLLTKSMAWSKEDIDTLHKYYRRMPLDQLATLLDRSYMAVQSKGRSERIHKHPRRAYNDRDIRFIIHTIIDPEFTVNEIGRQLHRSKSSLMGRLELMDSRKQLPKIPADVA